MFLCFQIFIQWALLQIFAKKLFALLYFVLCGKNISCQCSVLIYNKYL